MIDLRNEELLTMTSAQEWLRQRTGHWPGRGVLYGWIYRGIKGSKLDAVRLGGRLYTSVEALERFAVQLGGPPALVLAPVPRRRQREIGAAARRAGEIFGGVF